MRVFFLLQSFVNFWGHLFLIFLEKIYFFSKKIKPTQENVNPVQHSQPQIDLPLTKEISIEDYNMLQHVKEDQA